MKHLIIAGLMTLAFTFQMPAQAQGIPVIDAANLEQALQNIAAWQRQLQAMQQQYDQQVAQFKGLRGYSQQPASAEVSAAELATGLSGGS